MFYTQVHGLMKGTILITLLIPIDSLRGPYRGGNFWGEGRILQFLANIWVDFDFFLWFSGNSDGSGGLGVVF